MNRKLLSTIALLALSAVAAHATLIGSLHLDTDADTNGVYKVSGLTTRIAGDDTTTVGILEGDFSLLAGNPPGTSGYNGMNIGSFTSATKLSDFNRYGNSDAGGIAVWDFDLSGISSNAWEFKVVYDERRSDCQESGWYVSFTGLGRTLDTTDVTTLAEGTGNTLLGDATKYVKIGSLPAATVAGTNVWDITEIITAAQANGGLVRIVYNDHSYLDDIRFIIDSGLIAADSTSAMPVTIPDFYVLDDFDTGTAATNSGSLLNDWVVLGPEEKEYNVASSGLLDLRDAYLGTDPAEGTNVVHNARFETIYINFTDLPLTNSGDWLELSVDVGFYQDTSGAVIGDANDPFGTLTIVDSSKTNDAGYGFRMKKSQWHQVTLVKGPTAFPAQLPGSLTSNVIQPTDGSLLTWTLRIERSGGDFLITPTLDGSLFTSGPSGSSVVTNSACIDNEFDQLTLTVRGNDIGAKIDNVQLYSNVELVLLTPYQQWAKDSGLEGGDAASGADPDLDDLINYGEYIFDGNPTNGNDVGIQPVFDGAAGEYIYVLRNDDSLVASVLTSTDLIVGGWTTNAPMNVTLNDGGLTSYTNVVGTAADETFIKLLVE